MNFQDVNKAIHNSHLAQQSYVETKVGVNERLKNLQTKLENATGSGGVLTNDLRIFCKATLTSLQLLHESIMAFHKNHEEGENIAVKMELLRREFNARWHEITTMPLSVVTEVQWPIVDLGLADTEMTKIEFVTTYFHTIKSLADAAQKPLQDLKMLEANINTFCETAEQELDRLTKVPNSEEDSLESFLFIQ